MVTAATATETMWQPKEEGLQAICGLLEQQISSSSTADKSQIWQQLQQYSQFPDFNNYLAFILARAEGKLVEIRQAAGLLLKNNLRNAYKSMDPAYQQYIKAGLLPCLGAADRHIRSTVGSIISVVVQIEGVVGWPELLQALVNCLDSNDLNHMEGAMDALSKICEDVPQVLDSNIPGLSEPPISVFLPRLFQFFQSPHVSLRKLSLGSVNQYIMLMPAVGVLIRSVKTGTISSSDPIAVHWMGFRRGGNLLPLSDSRCKLCNTFTTADDIEEWVYSQFDDNTHLLHGVVHSNGHGHLLTVNGREGGSGVLSGFDIMNFWDRLCKTLAVRFGLSNLVASLCSVAFSGLVIC